jgi:hypothetical protein
MFGLIWASKSFRDFTKLLASSNAIKQDEIAAHQLRALKQHYTGKLKTVGREGDV